MCRPAKRSTARGNCGIHLAAAKPELISYVLSFITLGIFWNGQQAQLNAFTRSDRHLSGSTWLFFSRCRSCPFPPLAGGIHCLSQRPGRLLGKYPLLGLVLFASWRYATRAGLLREDITHDRQCAVERRIVVAQALYAFGAVLCLFNTYLSIGFIILVQLNFALAPRLPFLSEI